MKGVLISAAFFLGLVLISNAAHAELEPLTEWETEVYYTAVEKKAALPEGLSTEEQLNKVDEEVAKIYGITPARVSEIIFKAYTRDISEREQRILDELREKVNALPENASDESTIRVIKEVAAKYGISAAILDDIIERATMWEEMFQE